MLLYDIEECPLNISDLQSLDFVVIRFFMKLFNINVIDTVKLCQDYFDFDLPSVMIEKRRKIFLARFDIVEKAAVWSRPNPRQGRCEDEWFIKIYHYHCHCLLAL